MIRGHAADTCPRRIPDASVSDTSPTRDTPLPWRIRFQSWFQISVLSFVANILSWLNVGPFVFVKRNPSHSSYVLFSVCSLLKQSLGNRDVNSKHTCQAVAYAELSVRSWGTALEFLPSKYQLSSENSGKMYQFFFPYIPCYILSYCSVNLVLCPQFTYCIRLLNLRIKIDLNSFYCPFVPLLWLLSVAATSSISMHRSCLLHWPIRNVPPWPVASLAHCECSWILSVYWHHLSTLHVAIACHGGSTGVVVGKEEEIKKNLASKKCWSLFCKEKSLCFTLNYCKSMIFNLQL